MAFSSRTVGDVVSEILMSRTAFLGSFLLLEGETDSKFFARRIRKDDCQIVIAGSKTTVCEATRRAYDFGNSGVVGIVDDDYDSCCGAPVPSEHIIRTDARDLEALLIRSCALELVISETGSPGKIAAFEAGEKTSVRDALIRRSLIFGKLRLLNRINGWNFDFGTLSPWKFADEKSWVIDESSLTAHVANEVGVRHDQLIESIDGMHIGNDPFEILHGRDTANILAIGLRSKLGNTQLSVDKLMQMLRLAFDDAMAIASALFRDIRAWEARNEPYRVLL